MKHGTRDALTLNWYETGLSSGERKRRGHFSTPHALIDQILDACGYHSDADLRHIRVLDPACGSGNFLARAALRLSHSLHTRSMSREKISACIQANLWGLDPDPVACFLAEMQVRQVLESVYTGRSLHIHQADSLTLAWQECVDLLLANPPYLAAKNADLSIYSQAQGRGQVDSYLLFVDLALRVVKPGGWIGLVLPDPVLARANAAPERWKLLRECTVEHIWHLSDVFDADVGAAVLIARKLPPPTHHAVRWQRTRWRPQEILFDKTQAELPLVSQKLLAEQPGAELRYLLGSEQGRVSERLHRVLHTVVSRPRLWPLGTLVDIKRGEELGRASALLCPVETCSDALPVLRGGIDLRPYALLPSGLGISSTALKKPLARYVQPKLLVVKSTERLQAALDTSGYVVLQTLYLLQLREIPLLVGMSEQERLETYDFLLALLNSRLLGAYVYHLHTAYKLVQPQIEQAVLARLPIAWGKIGERREIAARASALARACGKAGAVVEWEESLLALYEEQERAIRALYASVHREIFTDKGVTTYG